MELNLTKSEAVRVRNLLCKEICILSENGALDPKIVTKTDLKHNTKALEYDRTALQKITGDADAALEKWKSGRYWKLYSKHLEEARVKQAITQWTWKAFVEKLPTTKSK